MKRRQFLRLITAAGAFVVGGLSGLAVPATAAARVAVGRVRRVPADLLARIRGRTRAFEARDLDDEHDLAG